MEHKTYLGGVCGTAPRLQVPYAYNMVLVHCSIYYITKRPFGRSLFVPQTKKVYEQREAILDGQFLSLGTSWQFIYNKPVHHVPSAI
jgi:hypothetical protein